MRLPAAILALLTAAPAMAASPGGGGAIAVETGAGPLTPWFLASAIAMVVMLVAAQILVMRGPRR